MKNVKPRMSSMRTDFKFSTRSVCCPHASLLGFSSATCKPGHWVTWCMPGEDAHQVGRVIGVVDYRDYHDIATDSKKSWLMVAALACDFTTVHMRWIDPDWVRSCYPLPPRQVLAFLTGEWDDPQAICDQIENGFGEDLRALVEASTR